MVCGVPSSLGGGGGGDSRVNLAGGACPTVLQDLRSIGLPHPVSERHPNTLFEIQGQAGSKSGNSNFLGGTMIEGRS